jgi:hypothetical protein
LGRIKVELEMKSELEDGVPGLAMGISGDLASPHASSLPPDRRQETAMDVR